MELSPDAAVTQHHGTHSTCVNDYTREPEYIALETRQSAVLTFRAQSYSLLGVFYEVLQGSLVRRVSCKLQ